MNRLAIRYLGVRAATDEGQFGIDIPFGDGLTVLRAENSRGKSTVLSGILYGLGLEGMLGADRQVPFPHALTDRISTDAGTERPVVESQVRLELENGAGNRIAVERQIKGPRKSGLIRVWHGPAFSQPGSTVDLVDYYVREGGAAVNPLGFHRMLAEFVGWKLPLVPTYQGALRPLYLECLFPLLFVEQKKGWGHLGGRFPTYLGIRDMARKSIEFLLGLSTFELAASREEVAAEIADVRERWLQRIQSLRAIAAAANCKVVGVPGAPVAILDEPPGVLLTIVDAEWVAVRGRLDALQGESEELAAVEIPRVSEAIQGLEAQLATAENVLATLERTEEAQKGNLRQASRHSQSIRVRLESIEEGLKHYADVKKLKRLGSDRGLSLAKDKCPTCHQAVEDALLPQVGEGAALMTVDQNIAQQKEQQRVFRAMRDSADEEVQDLERRLGSVVEAVSDKRKEIRSLKRSLVADGRQPSEAAVRRRLLIEQETERLRETEVKFQAALKDFATLAVEWAQAQANKEALPSGELSEADDAQIAALERQFRNLCGTFGVQSVALKELTISRGTLRPEFRNYNLAFDLSASDAIRMNWAFMVALLELGRSRRTNHPGMLVFDEPRQQSAAVGSFDELLRRLSSSVAAEQQVILATSEPLSHIKRALSDTVSSLIVFEGWLLKPLGPPASA